MVDNQSLSPGNAFAITTSDSVNQTGSPFVSLYIGSAGDVAVLTVGGQTVTYKNVPAGGWLFVQTTRVMATNTSATDIVGHH